MGEPAIRVRGVEKRYGAVEAVRGIDLDVAEGELFALLGPNGAGKTTTVEILEGHRERTSGDVSVLGMDPATAGRELRDRIGIVLQTSGIEPELTVTEAIDLYGSCYRQRRPAAELLELVGLEEKADARIGSLSGGQRRRIDLALGIVGRPDMLFLDEPTTGFDAAARRRSWNVVGELCGQGATVLLTTHYLDEAERLANRVGVLAGGRLVAEGTPDELVAGIGGTVVSFALPPGVAVTDLPDLGSPPVVDGGRVELATDSPTADLHHLTGWAMERGIALDDLRVVRPTLEDAFLQLSVPERVEDDG